MRLRTAKILIVVLAVFVAVSARAQVVVSNPLEWLALAEGNEAINGQVKDQTDAQTRTAVLQNTIAAEFTKMHEWEKKYSGYLQTVSGFASSLKASATLYEDGVRIFITLGKLKKAIGSNPQGIVATMSMNNLYLETATELISVYTLLKDAIATGGKTNMLTGAERSQTLWALSDKLGAFYKKLNRLYLSIRYYTLTDVWNNVSAGMMDRDIGSIAGDAFGRWKRAARTFAPREIPINKLVNTLIRAVVEPTAARATLPLNRPTTIISTALNINCRIPDNINGTENEISLSIMVPLHISISYLFCFTFIFHPLYHQFVN